MTRLHRYTLGGLLLWTLSLTTLLTIASRGNPIDSAMIKMAWGLIVFWIFVCGSLMYKYRDCIRGWIQTLRLPWQVTFVLFASLLALVEEAIAVSMTNLASVFGVPIGTAYITASTNYVDVVVLHSVVVFIPLFIAWALILTRYAFSPFAVFMLFGFVGVLVEVSFGGLVHFIGAAQWILIYGLMVYLPAYCIPIDRGALPLRWYHYLLSVPATFMLALPLLAPIVFVITVLLAHPSIHF